MIDAVVPEALGGSHKDPANLVTACDPCNSGKTSTHPDAPLVADVAGDALRWGAAVRKAARDMVADHSARQVDRQAFRDAWENWGYGEGDNRRTIQLPPDWEESIDQFLAAGLPLDVLRDCISLTMRRDRITRGDKFRYMCGVAWRKIGELHDRAGDLVSGAGGNATAVPASEYERGRLDFARELLSELSEETRSFYLDWVRDIADTDAEVACQAVSTVLGSCVTGLAWVEYTAGKVLGGLPDGIGQRIKDNLDGDVPDRTSPEDRAAIRVIEMIRRAADILCPQAAEAGSSDWEPF